LVLYNIILMFYTFLYCIIVKLQYLIFVLTLRITMLVDMNFKSEIHLIKIQKQCVVFL